MTANTLHLLLERGAAHLHRCRARATAEFLAEVARHSGGLPALLDLLGHYEARLAPELLRAVGGGGFPARPLHEVQL